MSATIRTFQVDGKFNAARFDQILQQQGMGRMEFRERLKQDVLVSQLQASLAASNFVTDAELENFVRLDKQTRDFASQTIHIDTKSIDISDDELKAIVAEVIAAVGATSPKDMGKVMPAVMAKTKGRADGKRINVMVRELLK